MAIPKKVRDELLVEARHRCTICSEPCFEIHHIIEQSEGGADDPANLIVLCPNCHQHRLHRSEEFTRDQILIYKAKLKEAIEIDRRLLQNLEAVRARIGTDTIASVELALRTELSEAALQVSPTRSDGVQQSIEATARYLAERDALKGGARRAIEIEWEIERARAKAAYASVKVIAIDEEAWAKADDFPAAYTFVLRLDRTPHSDWVMLFDREYRSAWYNMKRRTSIRGDRVVMIVGDQDDLQDHANFAKQLVERTNTTVERDVFAYIDQQVESGKRKALAEFDAIKSLKARTRNIIL